MCIRDSHCTAHQSTRDHSRAGLPAKRLDQAGRQNARHELDKVGRYVAADLNGLLVGLSIHDKAAQRRKHTIFADGTHQVVLGRNDTVRAHDLGQNLDTVGIACDSFGQIQVYKYDLSFLDVYKRQPECCMRSGPDVP